MGKIKVLIADGNYLTREGLRAMVKENTDFQLMDVASSSHDLKQMATLCMKGVLIIDHMSEGFTSSDLAFVTTHFPGLNILAITRPLPKEQINQALSAGVTSYLLKDCDKMEINEAIYATSKQEQFFCGKIVSDIMNATEQPLDPNGITCDGIRISAREAEIIRLVAEGSSNKEIAEKLFLSVHTVTTHRKNVMSKLGVNNTAGLVLFALKQNIISPNKYLFSGQN